MKPAERSYFVGPKGRRIRLHEWGDIGKPVIVLVHGFPGCGEHAKLMSDTPYWNTFRLIAMDRPGYGESDTQKKLTPLQFAHQITAHLNDLKIDKLSILSVSGGSPYSLALAYLLGERVNSISCIGGISPINRKSFFYMNSQQRKAWMLQKVVPKSVLNFALTQMWKQSLEKMDQFLFTKNNDMAMEDVKVFLDPIIGPELIKTTKAALQEGPSGVVTDLYVYGKDWGFDLKKIKSPVTLWHGTNDNIVNKRFSKYMRNEIPHAKLKFIPHESHYSLLLNQRDEILKDLIQ